MGPCGSLATSWVGMSRNQLTDANAREQARMGPHVLKRPEPLRTCRIFCVEQQQRGLSDNERRPESRTESFAPVRARSR